MALWANGTCEGAIRHLKHGGAGHCRRTCCGQAADVHVGMHSPHLPERPKVGPARRRSSCRDKWVRRAATACMQKAQRADHHPVRDAHATPDVCWQALHEAHGPPSRAEHHDAGPARLCGAVHAVIYAGLGRSLRMNATAHILHFLPLCALFACTLKRCMQPQIQQPESESRVRRHSCRRIRCG